MVKSREGKNRFETGLLGKLLLVLVAVSMVGCVAAVPVVMYMKSQKHYTATVQLKAKPGEVYQTVLRAVEERPDVKVENKDPEKFLIEATRGEQYASIKAEQADGNMSQLIVVADAGGKDEDKELALRIVERVCEEMKQDCKMPE